ncbi:hypothetical protein A3D42_00125 [Candidatus Nomurabacteria bacterium RIFCSPHIGHO2_02_FULL_41_18]|uniref:Peptidase M50 domain-containing protein n=1 Tax=Candidatus Nomurabacteria bacterium RIFCSPHIGHO2_02_FULL_41_18 TaxID=1801754 RepID=A0A1F6W6Z8_9BACT|nr:MAG: hypothetical protein A2737_03110 [Candidatus Nomurabacteria bacterium RIFCSPHIGHO2_01_FULL_41_71]OGI77679.1 MAG: hypothetical protein A3D42_00125 [Candidatus Nomurabacteria bacterium RIFCSPHIGHO2_02_FULL_41_18]OGI89041.1 MAG: hypothetical protein A3B01_00485 [Candidatus Nomurabacteria bacterium RIFCSPLOWO2_01_FULL_41_52b]
MNILIFFIILLILVLVHEFGHFFAAKKFGIRVDEFGFGFPPKLFGIKKGETEYTFNLFPIGGFVKIFGENPNEAEDLEALPPLGGKASKSGSFSFKPKWQQAVVLSAGILANFLLAFLLFSYAFISGLPVAADEGFAGYIPKDVNTVIISVIPGLPAANADLRPGDKIISMKNSRETLTLINPDKIKIFIISSIGDEIEIGFVRSSKTNKLLFTKVIPIVSGPNEDPVVGISMDQIGIVKLPIWLALPEGMKMTTSAIKETVVGLFKLAKESLMGNGSLDNVAGPVGLVGMVGEVYGFGFSYLISFTALISINLGIINLVPFPALDGGRLFFLLIEKIKGSRINRKFFNIANMTGFAILILFMLAVTYKDITKLF